jgi:N-acetyl-alpha-D-glucosaminyl L-malate synthase BshA
MTDTLKIGITCYPSLGGSGIVATELGRALARRGHEVHFISYGVPFRLDLSQPGVHFHEVEVNEYPLFRYPDYTLPLSVKMAEVSKRCDLDILHVHYAVPHATAAYLARQLIGEGRRRPHVVTTLHGTDISLLSADQNYQPVIKYSIENSCGVTAVSESLRRETIDVLGIERDIDVIYNFYEPTPPARDAAEVRRELGVAPDETLVIHSSNLRPVKRIPDLLRIAAAAKRQAPFKLLILAGASFSPYEGLVRELGLGNDVIVREKVLDIENYLAAADVGISTSEKESFGLSILESMAFGKPVIASRAGGVPEVVEDGRNGVLFPVGDIAAFAGGLVKLVQDAELRRTLGAHAAESARRRFGTGAIVDQYLAFYHRIIDQCR